MNRSFQYYVEFDLDREPWARTSVLAAAAARVVKPGLIGSSLEGDPRACYIREIQVVDEDTGYQITVGYNHCSDRTYLLIAATVENIGNPWELADIADRIIARAKDLYEQQRPSIETFDNSIEEDDGDAAEQLLTP